MQIVCASCLDHLPTMADNSIDAIVTDPPYEIHVAGEAWDNTGIAHDPALWSEAKRVLKPGGHLLAFSATRTVHRLAVAIEDAGFEIRDMIMWVYGSGMPKVPNVGEKIDEIEGNERRVVDTFLTAEFSSKMAGYKDGERIRSVTLHRTEGDSEFEDWRVALKPAIEPIVLARKPISESNIALNVLKWRTGAINIGDCRLGPIPPSEKSGARPLNKYPANFLLDGSSEAMAGLPPQALSYYYCSKPHASERAIGCGPDKNLHTTPKPIELMRYLCRLVTPKDGLILDPFLGSGTTAIAAHLEGFDCIGIEMSEEYAELARKRLSHFTLDDLFNSA